MTINIADNTFIAKILQFFNRSKGKPFSLSRTDDIVIITLPPRYDVQVWGHILDIVRKKQIPRAKHIVLDFSQVTSIADCGNELYILREEFRRIAGLSVIYAAVPPKVDSLFQRLEEEITDRIPRFPDVKNAILFVSGPIDSELKKN